MNQHKLVRIVRCQKRILKRARYPLRSSKYANHLYTDHQHVVLLALCHFRKSYRDFCEIVEVCTLLLAELGLRRGASLDYAAQVLEEDEHEEAGAPPPRVPGGGEG